MKIDVRVKKMYWAPNRHRHYAKLRQACEAEARAIVKRAWYRRGNDGYWADDQEALAVVARLARRIERNARAAPTADLSVRRGVQS